MRTTSPPQEGQRGDRQDHSPGLSEESDLGVSVEGRMMEDRPYQQRIITKAHDSWKIGMKSVLVHSPPGSGKTVMGFKICDNLIKDAPKLLKCKPEQVGIAWVAMRRNLLVQAEVENNRLVGCPNVHFISMFDRNPLEALRKYRRKIVVLDEAHHEATDSAHFILNSLDPAFILGLSATPMRTDRMKLCFQVILRDAGYRELIEADYLSPFNHFMVDDWKPDTVADTYLESPEAWGSSIFFFRTYEECAKCWWKLADAGVKCEIVTGETNRYEQLDKFESGEYQALINMFVLTEGFNFPGLKSVFVRDSQFGGPVVQMGGRVLRKFPTLPVKNIIQSVETGYPFTRVAPSLNQFVRKEGEWRSLGRTEMVKTMEKRMLERIMATQVKIPDLLLRNIKKRRLNTDFMGGM